MRAPIRVATAFAALVAGLLVLAACGGQPDGAWGADGADGGTGSTADVAYNDADVEFAQMMILHHEGAIEMADLVAADAATAEVRELGERISAAQGPEIDLMAGWLEAWGEPGAHEVDMHGMEHGGMDMDGLSQSEAMAELGAAMGEELDRRFLELMIAHHEGAVEMSTDQLVDGENPDALELAQAIIDAQVAEIAEMEGLLAGL